ncbi:hypothetical protein A6M21_12010 [Desulfotomaculum copahuensis]|uniref:Uncharacterized protein n=1 Tax=Desulfotomaculum copahuensis TaxID=1838280 RepID=A0A1B7LDI4_9FIRM|nr:hypothetical protein A6M21_12010 [Desulfotomaculum copahuensis]
MNGIYIDWQINHNIFSYFGVQDPNGIEKFKDFYESCKWQVAKIKIAGAEKLIVDINLEYFSYCRMTGLKKVVLEDNISGRDVLKRLNGWRKETGHATLEQPKYYLNPVAVNPDMA